jgi:hypothetical protein
VVQDIVEDHRIKKVAVEVEQVATAEQVVQVVWLTHPLMALQAQVAVAVVVEQVLVGLAVLVVEV